MMQEKIWQLMQLSFSYPERPLKAHFIALSSHSAYRLKPLLLNDAFVGFISYWVLDGCVFVEHFAIDPAFRNKGVGSRFFTLEIIEKYSKQTIVLEVEPLGSDNAAGRIRFYERLGFHLNAYTYIQPAYHADSCQIPLQIMSYPHPLQFTQFKTIRDALYTTVYQKGAGK